MLSFQFVRLLIIGVLQSVEFGTMKLTIAPLTYIIAILNCLVEKKFYYL